MSIQIPCRVSDGSAIEVACMGLGSLLTGEGDTTRFTLSVRLAPANHVCMLLCTGPDGNATLRCETKKEPRFKSLIRVQRRHARLVREPFEKARLQPERYSKHSFQWDPVVRPSHSSHFSSQEISRGLRLFPGTGQSRLKFKRLNILGV